MLVGALLCSSLFTLGCGGGEGQGTCDFRKSPNPQLQCREYDHSLSAYKASCLAGSGSWADGPCPGSPPFGCKDASMIQWYYSGTLADVQASCPAPSTVVTGQ